MASNRAASKLTDVAIRNAKAGPKVRRMPDGEGLSLEVHPNGAKYWRLRYRHGGKERMAGLGVWDDVSLKQAREEARELRKLIAAGKDPVQHRRQEARQLAATVSNTFEAVARDWLEHNPNHLASITLGKARWLFETFVFPSLGRRPVSEISVSELLDALRKVERSGKIETAHRMRSRCSQVFRYAIATDRAGSDPTRDLRGALARRRERHHAALTDPAEVGTLLRKIEGYKGQYSTVAALRLCPLVFLRPGELRAAEWPEIDLETATWTIPAARMKGVHRLKDASDTHVVPLCRQAVTILKELQRVTGRTRLVFPSVRAPKSPMSENTVTAALRSMGYTGEQMTAHGFRTIASTLLHELGYPSAVIEAQLAHKQRNKVAAAYNRAEYLPDRRAMMQRWADYLDSLRKETDHNSPAGNNENG